MKQLLDSKLSGSRRAFAALVVLGSAACGVVEHPHGDAQAIDTSDDFGPSGGMPVVTPTAGTSPGGALSTGGAGGTGGGTTATAGSSGSSGSSSVGGAPASLAFQ